MQRQATRNTVIITALSIIIFCAMISGPGLPASLAAPQPVKAKPEAGKLNIGLSVSTLSYLTCWVADQKGFFKEEGFTDVKVLAFKGDADVLQALAGGTIDISISSLTGVVESIKSGQKFKAFWGGFNQPYFDWYANPKFKSIAETKGGKYAISKYGALTDFLTRHALRSAGLDPEKDVQILQLGGSPQALPALTSGQIDVAILAAPASYVAAEKGFVKLMSQKDVIAPDWPLHVVFSKEEYIAKNQNTIKAFLRANSRAINWIRANPEEAAQIASKQTKYKIEYCRKFLEEFQSYWYTDGRMAGKGMKIFWEIAVQAGDITEAWPESKWLDRSFLNTQNQWLK
jgi:NitT/TauT family transport system substrate-binding protein